VPSPGKPAVHKGKASVRARKQATPEGTAQRARKPAAPKGKAPRARKQAAPEGKAPRARKQAEPKAKAPARKSSSVRERPRRTPSQRRALAELRASDPVLAELIASVGALPKAREGRPDRDDHYGALVRTIVGQQLSVYAARAIYGRLTERFSGRPPTPEEILADDPEAMRAAVGLSRAKVSFLRSLAEHVISGELELERMDELDDEAVMAELVAVKGLGEWSVHMFLMFHLERPDVIPVGDLGIRRAIQRAYELDALPDAAAIERIAEPWRPHRTLACRYLWRSLRNEPV
jgi:DNA-3-methyladenine glycosylase II